MEWHNVNTQEHMSGFEAHARQDKNTLVGQRFSSLALSGPRKGRKFFCCCTLLYLPT